ncbi:hypothetical protein KCP77_03060 [Salmonella enterica subsp. enterica]|nr:hypothetical protein KCP77_03060 [Salmonella enterica subsp. enterica]
MAPGRRRINLPAPLMRFSTPRDVSLCRRRVYWRRPAILTKRSPATTTKLFGLSPEGERWRSMHWTTVAKLPARYEAINQLQKINAVSPGGSCRGKRLLFASGRR